MIPSSLRHTQRHNLHRIGKRCLPSSNNNNSRFIFHHRFIAGDATTKHSCTLHHVSKRRNYNAISGTTVQQFRRMMSDSPPENNVDGSATKLQDATTCTPIKDLDEYYSSPLSLLEQRNIRTIQRKKCDAITINNETWYTAAYETNYGIQHSGTFGDLVNKFNPTLANEERININGINYYKTIEVAREAAAARVVDLLVAQNELVVAFGGENTDSAAVVPPLMRYCVEEPEHRLEQTAPMPEKMASYAASLENFAYQLHNPLDFLMGAFKRIHRLPYTDSIFPFKLEILEVEGRKWFTATLTDPATKETFQSGLVKPLNNIEGRREFTVNALPPGVDDVRIKDGKVYYASGRNARHAAAARAIDCYLYREGADDFREKYQLCLEEPYFDNIQRGDSHQCDYNELLRQRKVAIEEMPDSNHMFTKLGDKSFKSTVNAFPYQLHTPINLLENCYRRAYYGSLLYSKEAFQCDRVMANGREWFTATFTDPATKEVFSSGLVRPIDVEERRGSVLSTPLGEAEVRIMDGKVYYAEEKFARHAAAARAIDCFLHREGSDSLTKEYQLCLEAPYSDAAESSHQYDYDELLPQRKVATKEILPDFDQSNHLFTKRGDKSFKSVVNSFPYQLHTPAQMLEHCYRQVYDGGSLLYLKDAYQCDRVSANGREWFTATFTDPITSGVFSSGLVRPIDVEERRGSVLSTPLGEAEVRIMGGKVYYAEEKFARHAAAARAIDCFLHREGSDSLTKEYQLCFEAPYRDAVESSHQYDYDELLRQRKVATKEMPDSNHLFTKIGDNSFKSVVNLFLYQLHTPAQLLENCYRQVYGHSSPRSLPKEAFQCDRVFSNGRGWFTATFTDPITSEVFSSGLVRPIDVEERRGSVLSTPLGQAEVRIMGGKVYYADEKLARHAAAARAIDCFLHREGSDSLTKEYQLCLEAPYSDTAERDSRYNDYDELLRRRRDPNGVSNIRKLPGQTRFDSFVRSNNLSDKSFTSEVEDNAYKLHIPMQLLSFKGSITGNEFRTEEAIFEDLTWHTATFTDPNTSEVFTSGIGRRVDVKKKQGAFLSPSISEVRNRVADGKVYYRDKKLAKHAAAARAIDCYLYRETGALSKNQLCLEDPYEVGGAQDIDYDALAASRANVLVVRSSHLDPYETESPSRREMSIKSVAKWLSEEKSFKSAAAPTKSFKSVAENTPFQLHVPVTLLEKSYKQVHGFLYPKEAFKGERVMANEREWFTATFTDPVTSEVFSSGLVRPIDVKEKKGATLSTPLGQAEVHIMDGKVYYADEKFARHAAAARAIDCFLHREGSDSLTKEYQLCLEAPYSDTAERDSRYNDYDELLRRRRDAIEKSGTKPSQEEYFWKLHVPVVFLKSYLRERYDFKYYPKCIANESVEIGRKMWHTATFTDPNTSEVFPAGLVGPINAMQRDSWVLSPTLDKEEVRISDGRVYYAKLESARQAAAARAIDCYLYRDAMAIGESPKYQLCLEDPYRSAAERYSRHTDYDELLRRRRDATSLCRFADIKPPPEEYCDLVASRDNANSLDSAEDMMPYLDESDEDFTIVSRTYSDQPTRVDQKLSTLGRIAEIWAETPTNASSGKASVKTASFTKASRDPTENILNWFNRVDHTPSNFEQAMAFSQLCNKTLLALANENTKVINPKKCADIQREAKSILDKLTSISSQFADKDESVVNSETLNAYIQCLSRIDAEKSATVAEGLLKSMSEGKDNLPSPNAGTYNAVMKLWSSVDGEKGKNGVNDTFSLLQNAAVAREDLGPNRVSFQILLAANAKENNHFKYDLALASLERIKALSQDLCGEAFTPLADDYNAALKKTATNCFPDGDYYPPWVWHGQQYDGGFVATDGDKKCEALDMEKWLEHAEAMGASPSEDMYFQVIKAWTSTGSLEGLIGGDGANGAEELAKKAVLRSEGAPDMKIFYPIIAAWSLCGEKLGPDRVKEWIDQISLLGMKPDLDLQLAYFVAVEKCQSKLIDNMLGNNDGTDDSLVEKSVEVASTDGDIESLFKAAHNCSRYFEEMTSAKNRQDIANLDAFTAMLRCSIKAWSRASHSTLLLPDGSTPLNSTQGVEEMAKVLKRISLRNHGQDSADIDEALVNAAGTVCTEFTSQLRKLDSTRNKHFENNEKCHFAERIADVESSLRSYEFHSRRLASNDKLLPESNDIRHNLYRETLRGCAGVKLSTDYGHVLRICTLIMDCLSWHHELTRDHGSGKEVEDVTDIYSDIAMISGTCVKSPYERMNVLRSIYERASDFFPKKNPHHESSYARVDRAALLGSMRRSLGDSEMTDSFLSSFEEGKQGQRRRSRHRGNS